MIGLVAAWSWQFGLVTALQGPLAKGLGNTDFSWAAGIVVAGGLYYVLARNRVRASTPTAAAEERFAPHMTIVDVPAREGRGVRVAAGSGSA